VYGGFCKNKKASSFPAFLVQSAKSNFNYSSILVIIMLWISFSCWVFKSFLSSDFTPVFLPFKAAKPPHLYKMFHTKIVSFLTPIISATSYCFLHDCKSRIARLRFKNLADSLIVLKSFFPMHKYTKFTLYYR